ncbi:MmgE/PrpD family protein [Puniceibacterium sp. IMCC21224]|uniref:MmgE/PrpD family protein n=1 Tax=Puniceibacterium sp. IMCC21224 TaxID=1618204 RepID=UPI0018CD1C22|nr:MmgE/PrpD family protein [Puniceibacterium sp. IMCC21224]
MTGLTRTVAAFVTETTYADLPDDVVQIAKRCMVDGLGVMLAGSREPCALIARRHAASFGGKAEARTLGAGSVGLPAPLAALANGIAGHALDWDDTALSLEPDRTVLIHPTMQPLCAALAVGDLLGVSGRDMLTAFVLGFEAQVKIAETMGADHFIYGRGFHTTGTIGVFGATVTASRLMGLSTEQTVHAIAIAATMSSGLGENHGTMAKPLNMGHAVESGVSAARLASMGFDGPATALEGERGFFATFGGGHDPSRMRGRLGDPWAIISPGTSVKPYPSGVVGHPGMDAMKALVSEHEVRPEEIARIVVRTGPSVIRPGPLRIAHAHTALEGKFCVAFQMAAIALRRKAGLAEFSDEFVASPVCQDMQGRVEVSIAQHIADLGKDRVVFEIDVLTTDGRTLTAKSEEHYRGGPRNPLTWDELCDKFRDCADPVLAPDRQTGILDMLSRLEEVREVRDLVTLAC